MSDVSANMSRDRLGNLSIFAKNLYIIKSN